MKIKLLFILIFVSYSQIIFSQSGWFVQNSGTTESLNSVFFINSNTGWVCGNNGTILKTSNGGLNWVQQTSGLDQDLQSIFFINQNTGWTCGGKFISISFYLWCILKTTNGGTNWQIIINNMSSNSEKFSDIHFINENTGLVVASGSTGFTSRGLIWRTSNGGLNWYGNPEDSLTRLTFSFANGSTGYLSCGYFVDVGISYSYVLKTTNYGINWVMNYTSNEKSITTLSCIDENTVIGGGINLTNDGVISRTQNGGANWIYVYPDSTTEILSVFSANANYAWASTYNRKILMSSNSGLNWVVQQNPANIALYDLFFANSLTGWAVGNSGTILKTTTGGIVGVITASNSIPDKFVLYQNYPNPFNPVTKIKFDTPPQPSPNGRGQWVRLLIYDALGREAATLVNEQLNPGSYEVEWSATGGGSNYPSGVYFYKLMAEDFTETKKMILLK